MVATDAIDQSVRRTGNMKAPAASRHRGAHQGEAREPVGGPLNEPVLTIGGLRIMLADERDCVGQIAPCRS
jgi:hypothetical protein